MMSIIRGIPVVNQSIKDTADIKSTNFSMKQVNRNRNIMHVDLLVICWSLLVIPL